MGAASSAGLRVQAGPPEGDTTRCGGTVEPKALLPPACEDHNWLEVGLSTLVGTGDELARKGAGDFGRACTERRDSSNVRDNQAVRSTQVGAVSVGSCDEEDEWLEASLCLSVSSLNREETALVVARVRKKLFKTLSCLCSQDDAFCEVVAQRIHVMQCVHAAMSRQRCMQLKTDDREASTQPNAMVAREGIAGFSEDNPSSCAASGDQLLGLQLFFSLLEFVRDPECSQEQLTDFLQQIAPVLSSLPPLCLAGRSVSPAGVRSNQLMPRTPAPCVVDSLRGFLATLALADKADDNFPRKGDKRSIDTRPSSDCGRRGVALSAMISLVAARGRASDVLLLVKVLISARHRPGNAVEGLQDDSEVISVPGETVFREENVMADYSAKRRPTSLTKARTSRQGLPIDDDDGDDQILIDATVLAHPVFDVVVGPAVPVTGGDVGGDPWKGVTLGHSSSQGEGGEQLDTHPVKARKSKGERVKLTPPVALEPEPWKRVDHTGNEFNSAPDPSPAKGCVSDDTDGVAANDILPLLRQLHAATPNGNFGSGKADSSHEQEVWTCGQNSYGELGHSDTGTRKVHCLVKTFADKEVVDVAAGNEHTVLLCRTGEVFTAGYNDNGQCGQGATQRVGVLTCVPNLAGRRAMQVHAYNGCEHTLVVLDDGQLVSFGYNYRGQLGHGNTSSEPVPKPVRGLDGIRVTQVSCSYYHSVIACDNGEVYAFGRNDFGQLASGDTVDRKSPSLVEFLRGQRVTSLACGQYHTVVSTLEGGVQSCGKNDYGQLGVEPTSFQINLVAVKGALDGATVRHLRCGYYHTIVLMAGERVFGFGRNDYGQLGLGHITQRVFGPKVIEGAEGKGISKVSAGCYHTVLVGSDGMLYVFGRNHHGQLGTGDTNERHSPFPVDTFLGKHIAKVAAGFYHTIVLIGGRDEETSKLGSRGTAEKFSPRSILAHPALTLPRDASSDETTAEVAKENMDNCAMETMSPEISSPVCHRGSPGASSGSPTIKLYKKGEPRIERRTGRGICHGDGRVSGRKAAVVIMAHMDRLADSYAAQKGGVPVVGSTGATPANSEARCHKDQRGTRSDEENVSSDRDAYCVDICPHTFELMDAILAAIADEELFSDPVEEAHFQVYMLLAALRVLKANLARLLESPMSVRIITSSMAQTESFDLDDESELQMIGRVGHDPDLYTLLFGSSADGQVIVDDHTTQVIASHDGPVQRVDVDVRRKVKEESAGDVRLRSEAERYCNVLCCLQRRLLVLVQSGPFCRGGVGAGVELVQREAATVLILGLELFFTGQGKQFRLLSTLLNTAAADDDDEQDLSVGGECDTSERSMSGPRAARHFILVPLLRRFCDDALASKLIPYGADAEKGRSVCSVVGVTDPSLRGHRITTASPRLLEMQVALLVDLIAQGNPCVISSGESFADDERAAAFMPAHQEGSPFSVLQLNGSATNRTESFGLESDSVSKPVDDMSNDASRTQRLYVEVILTLTKHMMHWAASDRIIVDPELWLSRIMGDLSIHEREADEVLVEKDASIKTSGWFGARTKGLCDRATSVVLDGVNYTPSSWCCLIKHAHRILKHSIAILEATLERETQSHEGSGEGDAGADTRQLDQLEHTLVGLLLPAVITGLLPFAHIPVFARRLLDVVNATVVLMDEACYKCSGIRRADADYVAARNGDTEAVAANRKPQTLFVRGENGKLGAGGTAGRCSNGKPAPLEAEAGRKSPVGTRHNSHDLPWLLSLAKTTALLAGRLAATLVVGDCGISPILESFTRSPMYASWMKSDLLAGGCDTSYEWLMVSPLDTTNKDGSIDRGVSVVVTAPVISANGGLVHTSDPVVSREKLDQFLEGVADGRGQGGRFAAWLSEVHAPTDMAYRLIKRQAAAGPDGGALERAERAMLAAMLKHGGLDGDAALFSSRFQFERSHGNMKGYSRKPPRRLALLSKRMAEMVGWLWHSRSKLKSSDTSQSNVIALLEEAADACLVLIMFRPVAVVPPAFVPGRQDASRGTLSVLQGAARHRWRKTGAAIRAMIRWRSVVSGRFATEASVVVPRFMRAMLRGKTDSAVPQESAWGDGEISCGESSVACLSVLLILVLDNHQRAAARTCGLQSFRTLVEMVRTPSLLADILTSLAPAMQTPQLVDRHILTHLSAAGRSVTLGVTAAFQALMYELLRLAEESCLSEKQEDEGVASSTGVSDKMSTGSEVSRSNGCNYPMPRLFDVRTILVMLEVWGLDVRPEDWGFMETAGIIRIVALVASAPLRVDGDSSTEGSTGVDTSGRADSTREHAPTLRRGNASQPGKKVTLAASSDRMQRSSSTYRAAAWTLFRALIIQLHPMALVTRVTGTTSPQATSIMEVLHKELTKCVGKAQATSGDTSSGARRGGCRWDGEDSKHRDRTPSQAILEFAPPLIGGFPNSPPHAQATSGVKMYGAGVSHKRRCQELVSSPCRLMNMEDGLVFPAEHVLSNPRGSDFSITFWLLLAQDQTGHHRTVLARGHGRERWPVVLLRNTDNRLEVCFGIPSMGNLCERLTSKEPLQVNTWTHVGLISENNKLRLYFNGALDCQRTSTGALRANRHPLYVGKVPDGTMRLDGVRGGVEGTIASLRYFTRALSPIHVRIICDPGPPEPTKVEDWHLYQLCACLVPISRSPQCRRHLQHPAWLKLVLQAFTHGTLRVQQAVCRLLREIVPHVPPSVMANVAVDAPGARAAPLPLAPVVKSNEGGGDSETAFTVFLLRLVGASLWYSGAKTSTANAGTDGSHEHKSEEECEATVAHILLREQVIRFVPLTIIPSCLRGVQTSMESARNNNGSGAGGIINTTAERTAVVRHPTSALSPETIHGINIIGAELVALVQTLAATDVWGKATALALRQSLGQLTRFIDATGELAFPKESDGRDVFSDENITAEGRLTVAGGEAALHVLGGAIDFLCAGARARVRETSQRCIVVSADQATSTVHVMLHPEDGSAVDKWVQRFGAHDLEVETSDSLSCGAMVAFSDNVNAALPENGGVARYEYISEVMTAFIRSSPLPRPGCISGRALKKHEETAYREIVLAQSRSCLARVVLRASRNTLWATSAVETCNLLTELVRVSVLPRSTTSGVLSDESITEIESIAIRARLHQMLGMPGGDDIVAGKILEMAVNPGKMSFPEKEGERDLDGGEGNDNRQERNGANRRSLVSSAERALLDGMGCPFCHETITTVSGMVEHVLTKHSSDMRRMPCPICVGEKGDNAVHDLPTHLELVHLDAVLRGRRSLLPAFGQQRREAGAGGLEARAPSHLVDQLMVIGFPEEWCTMALRENDNDVVNASAWIVDNLDMLSSLNSLSASPADDTGEGDVSSPRAHVESSGRPWQISHRFLQEGLGRRGGRDSVSNRVSRGQQGELGDGRRGEEKYGEEDQLELEGDNSEDEEGEQRMGERAGEEEDEGDEEEDEEEGDNDEEEDSEDHVDDEEGGGGEQREPFDSEEEDEDEDQEDGTEDGNSRYSMHGIGRHQQVIVVPPSRPALNDTLDGGHHEIAGNHRITDGFVVSGHRDSYFGMENSGAHTPGESPHSTSNPSKGSQLAAVNSKIAGMELCQLTEVWLHTEIKLTTLYCRAALVNILLRWPPHVPLRTASFGPPATVVKLIQNVLFSGQDLPISFANDRHCDSVLQPVPSGSQPPKVLEVFASLLVHLLRSERDACCSPGTPLASGTESTTDAERDSNLLAHAEGQSGATIGDKGEWRNSLSARLVSDCLDGLDAAAGASSFTDVPWIAMESSPSHRLAADMKSNLQLLQWLLDLLLSVSCADIFTENVFSRLTNCLNSPNVAAKEVAMYSLTSVATRWYEHLTVEADQGCGNAVKPTPAPVVLPSPLAMEETFQRHMTIPRVRSALVKRIAVERRPGGLFFTRYTQTLTSLYVAMVKLQRLFLLRRRQIGCTKDPTGADCAGLAEVSTPTILYSTDSSVALTWLPMRKAASTSSTSTSYEVQMAARQLGIKEGQDVFRCVYAGKRLRCRVEDLMPGQVYRFRLRAVYSAAKTTTWSAVATAETEQGIAFRFDSANSGPAIFVSGNELSASFGSNETWSTILGTTPFYTGSNYWEFQLDKSATNYLFIGVATRDADLTTFLGGDDHGWGFIGDRALYHKRTKVKAYGERFGQGDTIGVTLNMDRGTLSFSKNGHDLGVAFEGLVGGLYPAVAFYNQGQRLSLVPTAFRCPGAGITILTSPLNTTPEDVSIVHEVMEVMVSKNKLPVAWMEVVRAGHLAWMAGTTIRYATSLGFELQFDVSDSACKGFGMKARRRVRTPRGIATVIGICDGVMWFHVDGEPGAWFFTASEIWEGRATGCFAMSPLDALGAERSGGRIMGGSSDEQRTDHQRGDNGTQVNNSPEVGHTANSIDTDSGKSLGGGLADVRDCARWTPIVDGCIVAALCDHADRHQVSVWNFTPAEVLNILSPVRMRLESLLAGAAVADDALLCRVSVLKQLNHELIGVLPFADLAEGVQISGRAESRTFCWGGSSSHRGLAVGVGKHPTRGLGPLLVCLRQSIFLSTKEKTLSQSVNITTTHSKKAEDEYDYPEDLPQVTVNRLKAVAGQESPDIEARLRTSVFHQLYRELRDIDTSLLRMGYMHPMDDGQRRTFKVKFEGEGVDDYGGPYREIFTQVATELTCIVSSPSAGNAEQALGSNLHRPGKSLLPILEPTPSTRSDGDGDDDDAEFMVKANVQQQRYLRMYRFLGQLMGIALRCRVAAPWRLSRIFWKGLVGEALRDSDLVYIDSTAHAFIKGIHERLASMKRTNPKVDEKVDLASLEGFAMESVLPGVPEGSTRAAVARKRIAGLGSGVRGASVKSSDLSLYVQEVAQAWLGEGDRALFAVRDGFTSVVPSAALPLFTWEEIELQVCGRPGVDVDLLERNTEYDDDISPSDAHIQSFWRVLRAFDDRDRSQFLRFVWARSRLPSQAADFHQKFKIHSPTGEGAREDPDQYLPKAHTCFFSINLPRYSSDEVMAKKLSYTMYNCIEMDADFRLADNEMPGWESEAANRSNREPSGGDSSRLE